MTKSPRIPKPPKGVQRIIWRLPILLYRAGLGWLLGKRFLLLNHIGRKSGLIRQAVIEVIRYDPQDQIYYSASGFGERADWFQNITINPHVNIQVGLNKFEAFARRLTVGEAEQELIEYAQEHPAAIRNLVRLLGYDVSLSDTGMNALAEVLPIVAFETVSHQISR